MLKVIKSGPTILTVVSAADFLYKGESWSLKSRAYGRFMETRASKRRRLNESLDRRYRYFPMSLAYRHWRVMHWVKSVDDYDFRVFPGFETVWMGLCDPAQCSDEAYVQIAQLALPGSVRLPTVQ